MNRSTFSKALQQPVSKASSANTSAGLRNLHQLIQLRWIAVVGQLLTIQATHYSLGLPLPLQAMLSIVAGMVVFNIASLLRWRTRRGVHDVELFIGLLIDVAALTAQLYLSGGIGNPFVFLYLLQVALLDESGQPLRLWTFDGAYPVKWEVEAFGATKNEVAIEKLELNYTVVTRRQ